MTSEVLLVLAVSGWSCAGLGAVTAITCARRLAGMRAGMHRAVHELRGPLAASSLALHPAVCGRGLAPERARAIDLELGRAGLALRDLEAEGQSRGRPGDPAELVNLHALLAVLAESWSAFAATHGVRLSVEPDPAPEAMVLGRPLRLAQAIGNLIANAVEHGGRTVGLRCRCDGALVRIEVLDDGPGLPAPVPALIEGAWRRQRAVTRWPRGWAAAGRTRTSDGVRRGHGLIVAAEVAAAHLGRLSSAPSERGARLVLELPRAGRDVVVGRGSRV